MEFGELIEPDTRAFWDNYDELDIENNQPVSLAWKWMNDDQNDSTNIEAFGNFFLIEGRQTLDFVQTTILKKLQPICQIDAHNTSIFRLSENDYLCVIADSVMDQAAEITELLTPWLTKAENVYAFKFQSAYLYNTTEKFDKRCFIRTIPTTADHFGFDFIAPMEDCNIVHGVSAGVSTWSSINNKPFACYAVYMDCIEIDSYVASIVLKLFHRLELKCDTTYVHKIVNKSNLYV